MSKLRISFVVPIALLLGATACHRNVSREAEDVEDARQDLYEEQTDLHEETKEGREDVREAQREVGEEKAEMQLAVQQQLNKADERYRELEKELGDVDRDAADPVVAQAMQAKARAQEKLQLAHNASTPEQSRDALQALEAALDDLERTIDTLD